MAVTFKAGVIQKVSKHARKAAPPLMPLDQPGRLRVCHLMWLFSISHTTLYNRIAEGILPPPDGYDMPNRPKGQQGRPYWNTETIRPLLQKIP